MRAGAVKFIYPYFFILSDIKNAPYLSDNVNDRTLWRHSDVILRAATTASVPQIWPRYSLKAILSNKFISYQISAISHKTMGKGWELLYVPLSGS